MKNIYQLLIFIVMCLFFSAYAQADLICEKTINIGDAPLSDDWNSSCESTHRTNYNDPYNPKAYPAKYYTFTLEREADIKISLSNGFDVVLYLLNGEGQNGTILSQSSGRVLESYLPIGTYTLEAVNNFNSYFTIEFIYNDIGNTQCVQEIIDGTTLSDGWIPGCESINRDIADPYSPYPELGFRAKYFTFSLAQDADIRINIDSDQDTYVYLLNGSSEFAAPLEMEFNRKNILTPLPAGDYTIELTTRQRYAPGNFSITYSVLTNDTLCTQELAFNQTTDDSWSNNCLNQTWKNINNDPYAGIDPERAIYYTFSLQETTDIKFLAFGASHDLVLNLYRDNGFSDLILTNKNNGYWSSSTDTTIEATLQPDIYTLEVTRYNQLALGDFSFRAEILGVVVCSQTIQQGQVYSGLLSENCLSLYREGTNSDPYAPQPGDYYAKRFEFELNEPQAINISGTLFNSDVQLYLSKIDSGGIVTLLEETEFDYWLGYSNQQIQRVLDRGKYLIELTSSQPYVKKSYSLSVNNVTSAACEQYVALNKSFSSNIFSSNCPSRFKASYQNPDPYGSPSKFVFNARTITFKVETADDFTFNISTNGFLPHLFLVDGFNRDGNIIFDEPLLSSNSNVKSYLEPGFYTLEITNSIASQSGSFNLKITDNSIAPEPEPPVITTKCNNDLQLVSQQTIEGMWPDNCQPGSSVLYHFSFTRSDTFQLIYESDFNSGVTIEILEDEQWNNKFTIYGVDGLIQSKTISLQAGNYRLNVNNFDSQKLDNKFKITVNANLGADSDGDGIGDDIDAYPEDASRRGDSDNDGIDDLYDNDLDNDGVLNADDAFPNDPSESKDDDGDNIGNVSDSSPYPINGIVEFTKNNYLTRESAEQITITISRSDVNENSGQKNKFDNFFAVLFRTVDGSAKAGLDYRHVSQIISFDPGELSQEIVISILNNEIFDDDKSFEIELHTPISMTLGEKNISTIKIVDDEPMPDSGIVRWQLSEQNVEESENTYSFEVLREGNLTGELSLHYATSDNTAIAGRDYLAQSGAVLFQDGEASKFIQVTVLNDDHPGVERDFFIDITSVNRGILLNQNSRSRISIIDDDEDGSFSLLSFADEKLEINSYSGNIGIEVIRTGNLLNNSSVEWKINPGNTKTDLDYVDVRGILQFEAGQTSKWLTIKLLNDNELNGNKSMFVELFNTDENTVIISAPFNVITKEISLKPFGTLNFSSDNYYISEKIGLYKVAVIRPYFRSVDTSANYRITGKSAIADQDFIFSEGTLNFSTFKDPNYLWGGDDVSQTIEFEIIDDEIYEKMEYFEIELQQNRKYFSDIPNEVFIARVYITDDDEPPHPGEIKFSGESYKFSEDTGKAFITIQRYNGSEGEISIDYSTVENVEITENSAFFNQHFNFTAGTIVFADGEMSKNIEIEIIDNELDEENKIFTLLLSNPVNTAIQLPLSVEIEIEDNDMTLPGIISIENSQIEINKSEGKVLITFKRTEGTDGFISVDFSANIAGKNSQTIISGTVIFEDGEDTKVIVIIFDTDKLDTGDSEFQVVLSNSKNTQISGKTTVSVKVIDDQREVSEKSKDGKKSTLFGSISWFLLLSGLFYFLLVPRKKSMN